jgi:hypothetical protein
MLMGGEPNSLEFEKRAPNSFKASAPSGFIDYYASHREYALETRTRNPYRPSTAIAGGTARANFRKVVFHKLVCELECDERDAAQKRTNGEPQRPPVFWADSSC